MKLTTLMVTHTNSTDLTYAAKLITDKIVAYLASYESWF